MGFYTQSQKYLEPNLHLNWFWTKTHLVAIVQLKINVIMI
jgi:hypothetical protein